MGSEWEPPKWRREGRSGPNGPKYASRKDRAAVRRGGKPGDNDGCALTALAIVGGVATMLGGAGCAVVEAVF
jgi:hypothetical protein